MAKSIFIYGASGHGMVVADIALACGYDDITFIDDGDNPHPSFNDIQNDKHIPIALGIGDNQVRSKLFYKIKESGFEVMPLIHPSTILSSTAHIGEGTVVMPNVVINAKASVGNGVILNTGCIIEHECRVKDFAHISPNVALAGNVEVGEYTHIGIGANSIQNIIIGKNVIIGAGSVVIRDIPSNTTAIGNPIKIIKSNHD